MLKGFCVVTDKWIVDVKYVVYNTDRQTDRQTGKCCWICWQWCPLLHPAELQRPDPNCTLIVNVPVSCNIVNTCHPHAQCVFIPPRGQYQCQCNAGYEGDGYECAEIGKLPVCSPSLNTAYEITMSVHCPFELLNQLTDVHDIHGRTSFTCLWCDTI
jgi:hypothetical protein